MLLRTPNSPPIIKPLAAGTARPLWSVMIPAYNCIAFLEKTLESVLIQDYGDDNMQIEVVDDCSTDGNIEELVQKISKGRVGYFRQNTNVGSLRNFETCLNRSKGRW
ncbi:MAG TPA: glycosyltransferase, partial [Chitinophagaceae bacterium]|nr:glycosyltransferase [Chitinophagaceae bacterium]